MGLGQQGESLTLGLGDVALLRGPDEFTVADDPSTQPQAILHPGLRYTSPEGKEITDQLTLGLRLWGNDARGSTTLLLGCHQLRGEVSTRLLAALPTMLTVPEAEPDLSLIPLLATELAKNGPGQDAARVTTTAAVRMAGKVATGGFEREVRRVVWTRRIVHQPWRVASRLSRGWRAPLRGR